MDSPKKSWKVILLGEASVGKSTLFKAFSKNTEVRYLATVGAFRAEREFLIEDKAICIVLWDALGPASLRCVPRSYHRDVDGVILMFDTANIASLKGVRRWWSVVEGEPIGVVVGNRTALERKVATECGMEMANSLNLPFIEVSALEQTESKSVFSLLAHLIGSKHYTH